MEILERRLALEFAIGCHIVGFYEQQSSLYPLFGSKVRMDWGVKNFRDIAEPMRASAAFSRLHQISFLGILSPRFVGVDSFPIKSLPVAPARRDMSRGHHSLAVAWITGCLCARLQLSRTATDYAVMWGLLHDIATWPLSHTGEAAFSRSTETNARELRSMMILGSDRLPDSLTVYSLIKAAALDHGTLNALFDKNTTGFDPDMAVVHKLIHSSLTPDTIEGMHRSGRVFGVATPHPDFIIDAFERDLVCGVRLKKSHYKAALKFWTCKGDIYSQFINKPHTIEFESSWSRAIQESYSKVSLIDSLTLPEAEIVQRARGGALVKSTEIQRYKAPLQYVICDSHRKRRSAGHSIPVEAISSILVKQAKQNI